MCNQIATEHNNAQSVYTFSVMYHVCFGNAHLHPESRVLSRTRVGHPNINMCLTSIWIPIIRITAILYFLMRLHVFKYLHAHWVFIYHIMWWYAWNLKRPTRNFAYVSVKATVLKIPGSWECYYVNIHVCIYGMLRLEWKHYRNAF